MKEKGSGLKAGVIGTGSLGTNHARIYSGIPGIDSVFVCDSISERAASTAEKFKCEVCEDAEALLGKVDLVSICTPATDHFETAMKAFDRGIHVLVEKPIASDSIQGAGMVAAARERGVVFQVGHIERFNGTFAAVDSLVENPLFIESHRLGTFTPRGTDVSVVVDLMIHDIDIVLTLLKGDSLKELRASGAGVLTSSPDIVNARLEFESGCVANLTASRISREGLRKVRFFQENMYISADFRAKEIEAYSRADNVSMDILAGDPTAFIKPVKTEVDKSEPLKNEIESFVNAVRTGTEPVVTGEQALEALKMAEKILSCIGQKEG
ncbi:MAG: Gfo/Idh/MocA family oxidoreductase [Candidatus Krumholzibacteria bacterium]|nr:Gfo/Idh/MocA family oxidoreductase [Candidatus Krumholzibacteria bacterium]